MRNLASVISGYVLWTVVWLAGNALLKKGGVLPPIDSQPIRDAGPLVIVLGLGIVCSVLAGFVARAVSGPSPRTSLMVLSLLLLGSGCYFELSAWNLTPIWYHVAFLAMLVPATLAGGSLRGSRGP